MSDIDYDELAAAGDDARKRKREDGVPRNAAPQAEPTGGIPEAPKGHSRNQPAVAAPTTPLAQEDEWVHETMRLVNNVTPDVKGKAFNPDWFLLRQRFEEIARLAFRPSERSASPLVAEMGELTGSALSLFDNAAGAETPTEKCAVGSGERSSDAAPTIDKWHICGGEQRQWSQADCTLCGDGRATDKLGQVQLAHDWQPDGGVLRFESHPGGEAAHAHTTCAKCGARAWFLEYQWNLLAQGGCTPSANVRSDEWRAAALRLGEQLEWCENNLLSVSSGSDTANRLNAEYGAKYAHMHTALAMIAEWDCLNPPRQDLLHDLPWLRRIVDAALSGHDPRT